MTAAQIRATQNAIKANAASRREAHFAQPGATATEWRGIANVHQNRKHEAQRKACRDRRYED
jgi:hypothetical protein